VNTLTSGLSWIDLEFLGRPHVIATAVARGAGGVGLIDPGPTSCLETLQLGLQQQGISLSDVTHILLTHVHLDHAGATGTILRRHPEIAVFVHRRGAPHLVDPTKLVQSATRLWGNEMERLWGEVLPVPPASLTELEGGERIAAGGRHFDVAYTPGHASHHVSYYDASSGVAFVGDTGGMLIDQGTVIPPTPPPDIDLELWSDSVRAIEAWSPTTLFRTHFGPSTRGRAELVEMLDLLGVMAGMVRESLDEPGSDEMRGAKFAERFRQLLRRDMTDAQLDAYGLSAPFHLLWLGLARYCRRRG
jgi:glyoxylase-like metal-dependent hydrolase (beta-lactamase superfamily II)